MHRGIGPVVFYTGFTRECIDGQGPSPKELLDKIESAVNTIAQGKKVSLSSHAPSVCHHC
jgi:hypothetical protein